MRYWDASVLVPLTVDEQATGACRRAAAEGGIVTWCLSSIEIASAIERRAREGALDTSGRADALANLDLLSQGWTEVAAMAAVRERAQRVLAVHALRAADALQLAAALVAANDRPVGHEFFCADGCLAAAAAREGFTFGSL